MARDVAVTDAKNHVAVWSILNDDVVEGLTSGLAAELVNRKSGDDAIIANLTQGSNAGPEIADARGTFTTLGGRIGTIEAQVYNVKRYGALGDGTTDDSAAINAAINAANAAGGGEVVLLNATYLVTQVIMKSYVTLRGQGYRSVLKVKNGANSLSGAAIILNSVVSVTIRDLRVDGNKANQTEPADPYYWGAGIGSTSYACTDVLIERVWVHDTMKTGVFLLGERNAVVGCYITKVGTKWGVSRSGVVMATTVGIKGAGDRVVGNYISDCTEHGIKLYAGHDSAMIADNYLNSAGDGIIIDNCNYVTVRGNKVLASIGSGITFTANVGSDANAVGSCDYASVVGNAISGSEVHGIRADVDPSGGSLRHLVVSGNSAVGCKSSGISIRRANGAAVYGNIVAGNCLGVGAAAGIMILDSPNTAITGNVARNNGNATDGAGIRFIDSTPRSDHSVVMGNRCYDDATGLQNWGIRWDTTDYLTIVGNNTTGCAYGIRGGAATNTLVANNTAPGTNYRSRNSGLTTLSNAQAITHGLVTTPTKYGIAATRAKTIVAITAVDATTMVVAMHNDAGAAITVAEPVAWWAEV